MVPVNTAISLEDGSRCSRSFSHFYWKIAGVNCPVLFKTYLPSAMTWREVSIKCRGGCHGGRQYTTHVIPRHSPRRAMVCHGWYQDHATKILGLCALRRSRLLVGHDEGSELECGSRIGEQTGSCVCPCVRDQQLCFHVYKTCCDSYGAPGSLQKLGKLLRIDLSTKSRRSANASRVFPVCSGVTLMIRKGNLLSFFRCRKMEC